MLHNCPICGKEFEARASALYCSPACKDQASAARKRERRMEQYGYERICPICGSVFLRSKNKKTYCSGSCAARAEKIRQEERRTLLSKSDPEMRSRRKPANTMADLMRLAKEATDHHMTYGAYINQRRNDQ